MLHTWEVRVEVGRDEAGGESLHRGRSLESMFWLSNNITLELWN